MKKLREIRAQLLHAVIYLLGIAGTIQASDLISLRETITPSALHDLRKGALTVAGSLPVPNPTTIQLRITDSLGQSVVKAMLVTGGKFSCRYPDDFPGAAPMRPGMLFLDATTDSNFDTRRVGHIQVEVAVILHAGQGGLPDFPSAFTTDLRDLDGKTDQASSKWAATRALVNLYIRSQGAKVARVGKSGFDLVNPDDFGWFKNNVAVYDFDHRDRDWSKPLGNRVARTFWKSAWNSWFNPSNDHPLDGNPSNTDPANYRPYAFSNDFTDWLILYWMRTRSTTPLDNTLRFQCRDAVQNLLAMQHRDLSNFALRDSRGRQENYTAGAFRYGMFTTGEFLTEGNGWFYNPAFFDYINGGVLNGRCVWGLGESLRHDPQGPAALDIKVALEQALRFCLHDAFNGGYARRTSSGHCYWNNPGEHAYLTLGMLAALEAFPDMQIQMDSAGAVTPLRTLCISSLNALVDLELPTHQWSAYPNMDAIAIAALAQGILLLKDVPDAAQWRTTAQQVADVWLVAKIDPKERTAPCIHFGFRDKPGGMTHAWMNNKGRVQFFYYLTGHWIHALADLYAATGETRYRQRAEAMVSYLCGDNPWQVRLFTETGGIYNWSDDSDGDGVEDRLKFDIYPESSAFCQIGLLRLLQRY